ncbi:MAG: hypothetical protein IKW08_01525 [Roseburia sp.]|nr:hypothetical protein [Roseburia sp.]
MFLFFILIIIIVSIFIVANNAHEQEALQKIREEENARAQKKREEFQNKQNEIIEFALKQGVKLELLYSSRDMYLSHAINYAGLYSMMKPSEPTYTRGVVQGSLADNVSTLANAQKKKEYDNAVAEHQKYKEKFFEAREQYNSYAQKIIHELKFMKDAYDYQIYEANNWAKNRDYLDEIARKLY